MLAGKKILLAVTGSIAAYKAAFFVRLLIKEGAEVRVLQTEDSRSFITPLTLATLSKNPVLSSFYKSEDGQWNNHVELGLWADIMVVAPLSANTLAKMANGICDNLLVAAYLSARCPTVVAPAMDLDMYAHGTTQRNLDQLRQDGVHIVDAAEGELASGLSGQGRMAEPEDLLKYVKEFFEARQTLLDKKILITSGPTYEAVDAVRFIGNHSSGKMGLALANEAIKQGAHVTFISGPVSQYPHHPHVEVIKVRTAQEMYDMVEANYDQQDIAIFAAAVSDFRVVNPSDKKRKRSEEKFTIELEENPDIAHEMGKRKKHYQLNVGFALETHNEEEYARKKLKEKNFDFIVLNSMQEDGAGFGYDTNKITIYDSDNNQYPFELKTKQEVAQDIIKLLTKRINA
jgi:phosphopantothenoylcysteine decarboxylase/phosphopantothenate--cysteine ligase